MRLGLLLLLIASVPAWAGTVKDEIRGTPIIRNVEPATAKAGTEVVAKGINLGASYIEKLFINAGEKHIPVVISLQTDDTIKFTVPANAKAGKYDLFVLVQAAEPLLIQEPVKLQVE